MTFQFLSESARAVITREWGRQGGFTVESQSRVVEHVYNLVRSSYKGSIVVTKSMVEAEFNTFVQRTLTHTRRA